MAIDRELLKQGLGELVQLRTKIPDPTRLVVQLYNAALEEWAGRLGVESRKLHNVLDTARKIVPLNFVPPARAIDFGDGFAV